MSSWILASWEPAQHKTSLLIGYADFESPTLGIRLNSVRVYQTEDKSETWLYFQSRKMRDSSGSLVWKQSFVFTDEEKQTAFYRELIELARAHLEGLGHE